jgi:hypothetical protein
MMCLHVAPAKEPTHNGHAREHGRILTFFEEMLTPWKGHTGFLSVILDDVEGSRQSNGSEEYQ